MQDFLERIKEFYRYFLTNRLFIEAVNNWALDYTTWHEPEETLRYCLGCRIGELRGALLPQIVSVNVV